MIRSAAALSVLVVVAWIVLVVLTLQTSDGDGSLTVMFLTLYMLGAVAFVWLSVIVVEFVAYNWRVGRALLADPAEGEPSRRRFANRFVKHGGCPYMKGAGALRDLRPRGGGLLNCCDA